MKKIILAASIVMMACSKDESGNAANKVVQDYLTEIADIMEQRSLTRSTVDWPKLRTEIRTLAASVQSIRTAEPILIYMLTALGDEHSHVITAESKYVFGNSAGCSSVQPVFSTIADIGYVRVAPTIATGTGAAQYARGLQSTIRNQDIQTLKGWIIDLRGTGGNMWPMLAGIGPILGEGIAGYSIEPDNTSTSWSYRSGTAFDNQAPITTVTDPYTLTKPNPKVAVLIDGGTASAGEAIAVSFIGKSNTRFFGNSTCGLSTFIQSYPLSDNSILELTVGVLADRNGNRFGGKVNPDEVFNRDEAVTAAATWINK